jgi:hypothetical protein
LPSFVVRHFQTPDIEALVEGEIGFRQKRVELLRICCRSALSRLIDGFGLGVLIFVEPGLI